MKYFELKQHHVASLDAAQAVLQSAESAGRPLTENEQKIFDGHMLEAGRIAAKMKAVEGVNTIFQHVNSEGQILPGNPGAPNAPAAFAQPQANVIRFAEARTPEYSAALHQFLRSGGKAHGGELTCGADGEGGYYLPGSEAYTRQRLPNGRLAATYEGFEGGSGSSGGYAVSVPTDPQIVPLALPDLGVFNASTVIPTATDVKIPQQASFGTSAIKSESTGTIGTFGGTDPTLSQISLTSYMVGALRLASWELLQDVNVFQSFIIQDLLNSQRILEGQLYASGTGTGQPQGLFGNTGLGTGSPYSYVSPTVLLESLFDVTATLKGPYQAGAGWVMSRATGLAIRSAQMQTNLYIPVVTMDADGTERILGKPVFYDVNAPSLPTSTNAGTPAILFGDFKAGNLIGVRGGGGINVKILDQPWAAQGQLGILAYRRVDSRVRLKEAIQAISFSHA